MVAILGYSREQITHAVQDMYTTVAEAPLSPFHFPVGAGACRLLGYPAEYLEQLPPPIVASFAGVGYPFHANAVQPGDVTLDLGAGAGNDSLIAEKRVGTDGRVIALDLTAAMTRKLKHYADDSHANIDVIQASAEQLPLVSGSVDSITSNGALNLVPDKRRAIAEMFRVLRPGGRLQLADVVIDRPVSVDCHTDPRLWVECVVGATVEEDLLAMLADAGFEGISIIRRLDYFAHSPSEQTRAVAASFGARAIELSARRGPRRPGTARQWLRRSDPRRWLASLQRRGFLGVTALLLALLTCYGTLAAIALLTVLGVGFVLDETLWAGTISLFTVLAVVAIATGIRRHHMPGPALVAAAGAGLVGFALFIEYSLVTELSGFLALLVAAVWDLYLRRREEARRLGLDNPS